jgi:hypothetical protein
MSRKINVNPGQYKVAGREKPGKPTGVEAEQRERLSQSRKQERGADAKKSRKR